MDKLKLLGLVFNSRRVLACVCHAFTLTTKQPNLKLKGQFKQPLDYLSLAFELPASAPSLSFLPESCRIQR